MLLWVGRALVQLPLSARLKIIPIDLRRQATGPSASRRASTALADFAPRQLWRVRADRRLTRRTGSAKATTAGVATGWKSLAES